MKRKLYFILCLITGIISCTKENTNAPATEKSPVSFTLADRNAAVVKSSSESSAETKINNYQIFVFNEDGTLDVSGYKNGSGALTLDCSIGKNKSIFALANHRENITGKIARESDLNGIISSLSDNDIANSLVMSGRQDENLLGAGKPVTVGVDRLVAKVKIDKITNNLNPSLGKLTINAMYCINVCGDAPIIHNAEYQCQVWYNRKKYEKESTHDNVNALISETGIAANVRNGDKYTVAHCFYVYPNNCISDTSEDSFSPRFTRLVVDVTVENDKDRTNKQIPNRYYAIDLVVKSEGGVVTALARNKLYHITGLDIQRLGSLNPDQPVVLEPFEYSVSVNDWGTGFDKDVEI